MSENHPLENISADPLYRQLLVRLRNAILSGEYPVDSRVPSEKELCQQYGISRVTVRRALKELTDEGLLKRHQGKGSFVTRPRLEHNLGQPIGFSELCNITSRAPATRVVGVQMVEAGEMSRRFLKLHEGDQVIEIVRVRYADGEAVAVERDRFSMEYSWLMSANLSGSLYELLAARGIRIGRSGHEISMEKASDMEAAELGISPDTSLVRVNALICNLQGNPLFLSSTIVRGDIFTLRL